MPDAVCIFRSFVEAIDELDEADQLAAYKAIVKYGLDGEVTDVTGPAKAVFLMAKPVVEKSLKRAEAGAKGGKQKAENAKQNATNDVATSSKTLANSSKPLANGQQTLPNKHKDIDKDKDTITPSISPPLRRQIPPTVEMVREYCNEKGFDFDPQAFVDHYESNGWMVGKTKMKDWQASCRTWAKSPYRQTRGSPKNKIVNFEQHDYDFDETERALTMIQVNGYG